MQPKELFSSTGQYKAHEIVQGCGPNRSQVHGDDSEYQGDCVVSTARGNCKFPFTENGQENYNCKPYANAEEADHSYCLIGGQRERCLSFNCGQRGSNIASPDINTPRPTATPDENSCLHVFIKPDLWPEDIKWRLYDMDDNLLESMEFEDQSSLQMSYCFPRDTDMCWRFVIIDREKNGLCCSNGNGFYRLFWNHRNEGPNSQGNGLIHHSSFKNSEYEVVIGCKDLTPENPGIIERGGEVVCDQKSDDGMTCLFPFIDDDNKVHNTCAVQMNKNENYHYCATIVDHQKRIARKRPCGEFSCREVT